MIGKTIAQYEILEQLGAGGMGVVYKARDTKLDRIVALKFLPQQLSTDPATKQRFMQEARAASALDDPNICTIHDIAEADDGQLFIVMAYYDGSTLKYVIDDKGLDVEKACSIARQIALGLGTAHEAGIVHRDVKPANIMITEKGSVKILDFGVAKLGESSDLTRAGSTIGTAAYMSPEQAKGETVDAKSDIWSIGIVLYEMLSGHRPFGGGYEAAVAYSIINEDPAPIPGLPPELTSLIQKVLAKDPASRPNTASELANELAPFAGASAIQTRERPAFAESAHPVGTQRVVLGFSIVAVVVLGALYGAMLAFGLPGWVFPAGVLLTLIGLPIILYSQSLDRKRAKLDSGERHQLTGLKGWLTTKRALQGGYLAGGGLVAITILYVGLRAAGIGPFASLISGGTLDQQDAIIVSDFQNQTSDPTLGLTVTEAFKIDLSQSSAIRMLDRSQVVSALQRMQVNPDTTLTPSLALQLAEREGAKAIIEGDINAAGASFILNARIISAIDGSQLAAFRQNARTDADILDAIDQLSAELREGIGESLVDIRGSAPLDQVTTSNIEALRLYTEAEDESSYGNIPSAIEKLERVIEMDSTFAMGYRKLAVSYGNAGEPREKVEAIIKKGYRHKENLPIRERLLLEALYLDRIDDDDEGEARKYEEVLRKYPYEVPALNNLSIIYQDQKRWAEAESLIRRALEVEDGWTFHSNLVLIMASQGKREEAYKEVADFEQSKTSPFRAAQFRSYLEFTDNNIEGAYAWLDSMEVRNRGFFSDDFRVSEHRDNLLLAQGKLKEGRKNHVNFATIRRNRRNWQEFERNTGRTRIADSLSMELDLEWERALLTGDNQKLMTAYATFMQEVERIGGFPDDEEGPQSWLAGVMASTGNLEEAKKWRAEHTKFHLSADAEENSDFGKTMDAYVDARLGTLSVDEAIASMLASTDDMGCAAQGCYRDWIGDLEAERGNIEAAIAHYEAWTDGFNMFKLGQDEGGIAVYNFRLGALYEQLGNFDEAIKRYTFMADRWKDADAVLQPQVAEARRRIETLLDRKAKEN